MNIISAVLGFLVFLALLWGAQSVGIVLPCGVIFPAVIGGLVVGAIVK
jgi:hypothetical protein